MTERQYDIKEAADALGFSQIYIRTLIRRGTIPTTKVPLAEGSLVTRHMISQSELDRFLHELPHKSRRSDGRNKFIMYARPDEYSAAYQCLVAAGLKEVADLILPANKVKFWEGGSSVE